MIIGLTGKNGAGKGEVANILVDSGFIYHSLSDAIRDEAGKNHSEITRDILIETGNKLRHENGASVLADRILLKLDPEKNYAIDSIRNPAEVQSLRRRQDFTLIEVKAFPETRFERLKSRNRENDPQNYDQFLTLEKAEESNDDPLKQQLRKTISMADHIVENNGTLNELSDHIRALMKDIAQKTIRPSWDEYFMGIAKVVALRSNCIKRKVAAVIVKDKRIISTGYNGTPRGITNCNEGGCPRCNAFGKSGVDLGDCLCSHAEENAIVQSAYHGVNIQSSTLYTTFSPCLMCTKMIINSGISEVVFQSQYPLGETSLKLLKESYIQVRKIS